MQRTLINLDVKDKAWLDHMAKERGVSMAEVVRTAVRDYRERADMRGDEAWQEMVRRTAGIWRHGDGLDWQRRLRDEWNDAG